VKYSGRVQGVGFRASARKIAASFKLKGWVKNLPTGEVELVILADEREIEAYLKAIRDSRLGGYIDREVQEAYSSNDFNAEFEIRH